MPVGTRSLINFNECLRYSLIPSVMMSMFGVNNITPFYNNKKCYFQQSIEVKYNYLTGINFCIIIHINNKRLKSCYVRWIMMEKGSFQLMFDGDEMNIHLAQSVQAINELKRIANVKYQIIGAKNSNPIIGCVQDALAGSYLLTKLDTKIKGSDVANFLCNTSSETKNEIDSNKIYTGHEIFSHIIPKGINKTIYKDDKKVFEIVDGKLKIGILDKTTLSNVKNSIIHFIWDKYGPDKTKRFIDDTQRLAIAYLNYHGFTFGIKDCMNDVKMNEQIKEIINNKILEYNILLTQNENETDQINVSIIESNLSSILNAFSSEIGNILMKSSGPHNNLFVCIDSKSKGNPMNMQHIMGCVGQKSIEGVRIKKKIENRTLPIFHRDDDTPEARGFIKSSYIDGVNSYEYFYDAMAGREGLIDTAIKSVTWETQIVIIEENQPKYIEIGKWIDNLLEKNNENIQHFTEKQMELLDTKNIYIPTMDYQGNVSWGEVSAVTRHDPTEKLYEIKTCGGRSVTVTDSKSLLVFNNKTNEFKEMLTPEIKVGDFVPVTGKLCEPPIIINMYDNNVLDYNYGLLLGEQLTEIPHYIMLAPIEFINGFLEKYNKNDLSNESSNKLGLLRARKGIFNEKVKTLNNVVLDEICEIKLVDVKDHPKVYDLTIPSTFNFGLANGLQVRDTAKTGYVQRQLIKGLEDLIIKYDNTNRNSKNVIVQYVYGENGIDQSRQTELTIGLISLNNNELEATFGFTKEEISELNKEHKIKDFDKFNKTYINKIKEYRDKLRTIQMISNNNYKTLEEKYMLPVNLFRLTQDYSKNKVNTELNPEEILDALEELLNSSETRLLPGLKESDKYLLNDDRLLKYLFEISLHDYLCPKKCIFKYGLSKKEFKLLLDEIKLNFIKSLVQPGEMVGIIAAQSIGEPTSQITLNSKHSAGVASKSTNTTGGIKRIEELLHYSKDIKTPQMTIYFDKEISNNRSKVNKILSYLTHLTIKELISSAQIYYDVGESDTLKNDYVSNPFFVNNQKVELSSLPFVFRIKLNMEKMHDKETTLLDIKTKFISHWTKYFTNMKNLKKNEKDIFSKISRCAILSNNNIENQIIHIRFNMQSFNYNLLNEFLKIVLDQITLKGIDNITNSELSQERKLNFNSENGNMEVDKEYVVYTNGINMEKLKYIKGINHSLTTCNDISTMFRLYGIEASRQIFINEISSTFNSSGSKAVNHGHMSVLVDSLSYMGYMISMDRHGLNKIDSEPLAKASFEKTVDHFVNAALFNQTDNLQSVSSRVMFGRVIPGGTGAFELMLDTDKLVNSEYSKDEQGGRISFPFLETEKLFEDIVTYGFSKNDFFLPV